MKDRKSNLISMRSNKLG